MSKQKPRKPNEQEVEELVAYLDGELTEAEAQQVEARLNVDPVARRETDALQKAWDMLDHLPRAEPSPEFTTRTVNSIEIQATTARLKRRREFWARWSPRLVGLGWAAGILLFFLAGFFAFRLLRSAEPADYDLARDLRLIENKRLYELVDSVDFLRTLDTPDLFGEEGRGL
jgi:anti-sigma factor RsiW